VGEIRSARCLPSLPHQSPSSSAVHEGGKKPGEERGERFYEEPTQSRRLPFISSSLLLYPRPCFSAGGKKLIIEGEGGKRDRGRAATRPPTSITQSRTSSTKEAHESGRVTFCAVVGEGEGKKSFEGKRTTSSFSAASYHHRPRRKRRGGEGNVPGRGEENVFDHVVGSLVSERETSVAAMLELSNADSPLTCSTRASCRKREKKIDGEKRRGRRARRKTRSPRACSGIPSFAEKMKRERKKVVGKKKRMKVVL